MLGIENNNSWEERCLDQLVIFVLDTSGSMSGYRMLDLNTTMEGIILGRSVFHCINEIVNIKIAVLEYNSNCRWVTPVPLSKNAPYWEDLEAKGMTGLGAALQELEYQLNSDRLLQSSTGARPPFIVYVTDGVPTDLWKDNLQKLWGNCWYKNAIKFAIAVGDSADPKILAELVGSSDTVFFLSGTDSISNSIEEILRVIEKCAPIPWEDPDHTDDGNDENKIDVEHLELAEINSSEQADDYYNRQKCKLLRTIRNAFAEANGIPFKMIECLEEGQCMGTCPHYEEEVQAMSQLLANHIAQGKPVAFPSSETTILDDFLPYKTLDDIWGDW